MKATLVGMTGLFFCLSFFAGVGMAQSILLSPTQTQWIGEAVLKNESPGQPGNLLRWEKNKNYLSLGIGNFIWYPAGEKKATEDETFVKLVAYLRNQDQKIPAWLDTTPVPPCPWRSYEEFVQQQDSAQANELRRFLAETKASQTAFLISRMEEALPAMLASVPDKEKLKITKQFFRLATDTKGVFVLVDYINFQGIGVLPTEKYAGEGWGLLSVLQAMDGEKSAPPAVAEFVDKATEVLTARVENAPPGHDEYRYLPSWLNRVKSYLAISPPVESSPTAKPAPSITPAF